jgi:hypothetical protein
MSPLQLFLMRHFDADPAGTVPLIDFLFEYVDWLDGTEAPEWRDKPHVFTVLSRTFTIAVWGGCRHIVGLTRKPVSSPETFTLIDGQLQGVRNVASK